MPSKNLLANDQGWDLKRRISHAQANYLAELARSCWFQVHNLQELAERGENLPEQGRRGRTCALNEEICGDKAKPARLCCPRQSWNHWRSATRLMIRRTTIFSASFSVTKRAFFSIAERPAMVGDRSNSTMGSRLSKIACGERRQTDNVGVE